MNGFALILSCGCMLGLWNINRRSKNQLAPAALLMMGLALLGARASYVLMRLPYYSQHTFEIARFSAGGLDGAGAILGGLLGFGLVATAQHGAFLQLLEESARLFVPVSLAVWLGCWFEGAAYGAMITIPSMTWLDLKPTGAPHWPLPVLGTIGLGMAFFWLDGHLLQLKGRGRGFFYFLAAVLTLLLISLFRQDEPAPFWNGVRLDILEATLLSLAGLAACLAAWVKIELERKAS
jgi:prolipoprotein diacylglyceryltransferase